MKTLFDKGLEDIKTLGIRLVQHEDEFLWLFEKVYELQPKIYFQIGSFQGACEIVLSRACADNAIIVSIDNGTEGRKGEERLEAVHRASEFLNQKDYRSFVIEGDSSDELTIKKAYGLLNEGIYPDFIYIDGGHSFAQAVKDHTNYRVRPNGMVAFHDINPVCNKGIEVHKYWKILEDKYLHAEFISRKKNGGVGIIYD